jgi:hypothetical protein
MSATSKLVWASAIAGLLAGITLTAHRRREGQRRTLRVKPEPLQTWEGEGGAVPLRTGTTAPQVTPSSANTAGSEPRSVYELTADDEVAGGPSYGQGRTPS